MKRVCVVAVAVFSSFTVGGRAADAPLTFVRDDYASVAGARGIAAADFNRDGWIDLAQANTGGNTVTILLNQHGRLSKAADLPVGVGPFDITTADFNGDAIPDLAVANADNDTVSVLIGRGDGTFTRSDIGVGPRCNPRGILAADVTKDGRIDLVISGYNNNSLTFLRGDGTGHFSLASNLFGIANHPQGMAVADVDRNGRADLIVAYDTPGGLAVIFDVASGTFGHFQIVGGGDYLNVVAVADLNRDGWIDVAAASVRNSLVSVFLGGPAGLVFNHAYVTGSSPSGIAIADVNQDGLPDIVTGNRMSNTVSVLVGQRSAPGTFAPEAEFTANLGSRAVAVADYDLDGHLDIATGNQRVAAVSVLSNRTSFARTAFAFRKQMIGPPSNEAGGNDDAWPADFNRDGKPDVVTLAVSHTEISVFLTGGPTVTLQAGTGVDGLAVGDFNGDGNPDVLAGLGFPSASMGVFLGNGRGGFGPLVRTGVPVDVFGFALGDFNGDVYPDLVVSGLNHATAGYQLHVMLGNGDGTFRSGGSANLPGFGYAIAAADWNRDGKTDVGLYLFDSGIQFWTGDGAGNLVAAGGLTTRVPNGGHDFAFADVNHDGFLDALVAGDQVVVVRGSAAGFGPSSPISMIDLFSQRRIAVADVNDDGNLDVVSDAVGLARGRGDGTFEPPDRFDYEGVGVHVADFNNDGLLDVIYGASTGEIGVLLNRRTDVNTPPILEVGPPRQVNYQAQFGDDELEIGPETAYDPDVHALTFEWKNAAGSVVSTMRTLVVSGLVPGTYRYTLTARDGRGGVARDDLSLTIVPTKEIVLHSTNAYREGDWAAVADATAADGVRAYAPNRGAPKVTSPLASPPGFVVLEFVADPTQTYKLWVRLKADANYWGNDSIWVQFSGAADAAGRPVYRSGTTSGLPVNLEECANCGEAGWGWEDDGWGAPNRNGTTLRFPSGGRQSLVIQTREDGVSFDQIVLSSDQYLTRRPGLAKNDQTILPSTYFQQ